MVQDIELGTLTASGWDTSSAPVASTANIWQGALDPTVNDDIRIGVRVGDTWLAANGNEWRNRSNAAGAAVWRFYPRLLHQSGTAVSHTGNTSETVLRDVDIAANVIGLGCLECRAVFSVNNDASTKTARIRFGANGAGTSGTSYGAFDFASVQSGRLDTFIQNLTASTQKGRPAGAGVAGYQSVAAAAATSSINTAAACEVVFTGALADGTDTITLEWSEIVLTRPDIGP